MYYSENIVTLFYIVHKASDLSFENLLTLDRFKKKCKSVKFT